MLWGCCSNTRCTHNGFKYLIGPSKAGKKYYMFKFKMYANNERKSDNHSNAAVFVWHKDYARIKVRFYNCLHIPCKLWRMLSMKKKKTFAYQRICFLIYPKLYLNGNLSSQVSQGCYFWQKILKLLQKLFFGQIKISGASRLCNKLLKNQRMDPELLSIGFTCVTISVNTVPKLLFYLLYHEECISLTLT